MESAGLDCIVGCTSQRAIEDQSVEFLLLLHRSVDISAMTSSNHAAYMDYSFNRISDILFFQPSKTSRPVSKDIVCDVEEKLHEERYFKYLIEREERQSCCAVAHQVCRKRGGGRWALSFCSMTISSALFGLGNPSGSGKVIGEAVILTMAADTKRVEVRCMLILKSSLNDRGCLVVEEC